jgi:hypothetical protein
LAPGGEQSPAYVNPGSYADQFALAIYNRQVD